MERVSVLLASKTLGTDWILNVVLNLISETLIPKSTQEGVLDMRWQPNCTLLWEGGTVRERPGKPQVGKDQEGPNFGGIGSNKIVRISTNDLRLPFCSFLQLAARSSSSSSILLYVSQRHLLILLPATSCCRVSLFSSTSLTRPAESYLTSVSFLSIMRL